MQYLLRLIKVAIIASLIMDFASKCLILATVSSVGRASAPCTKDLVLSAAAIIIVLIRNCPELQVKPGSQ